MMLAVNTFLSCNLIIFILTVLLLVRVKADYDDNDDDELILTNNKNLARSIDKIAEKIIAYEIRSPLILNCNLTSDEDSPIVWEKNDMDVSKVDELKGRYKILNAENKFIIEKTDSSDAGNYSCKQRSTNQIKDFIVVANVIVRVPSNVGIVEGEKLTLHCAVAGSQPIISWQIGNQTINESTDRYILKEDEDDIENAKLIIEDVTIDDRGEYKCIASNLATKYGHAKIASDVTFVRVKGKLAALWPFLGICAEVFILCAIILIYEKRRNKVELDESDTDPNTEQEKLKPQRN